MGCYYHLEDLRVRSICTKCKQKLYPDENMIYYSGAFGAFDIYCHVCREPVYIHDQTNREKVNHASDSR